MILGIFASLYTEWRKKAVKIAHLAVNMPANGGEIEVKTIKAGHNMGGTSKKPQKDKTKDSGKKSPPKPVEDDDEDGDMATPKRDRYGEDDQPL
jgi:hypothetical protein